MRHGQPLVLLVAAHPDDEILGAGIWLRRHTEYDPHILHITDGSPRDMQDARAAGFATRGAYGIARQRELRDALALVPVPRGNCHRLRFPDKEAYLNFPELVRGVDRLIRKLQPSLVITHAYEGGHPDHDAAAFAVAIAQRLGNAFRQLEFPLYHGSETGGMIAQQFLPGDLRPQEVLELSPEERALKSEMLSCFRTQAEVLRGFSVESERFRESPQYDFSAAPHPGPLLYEVWGWGISGAVWRARAAEFSGLGVERARSVRLDA